MYRHLAWLSVAAVLVSGPVLAQGTGEGLLNAVAFDPIPQGMAVTVSALDDSDDNLVLQEIFESELTSMGYTVAPDAPLVLSFETQDVVGAYTDRDPRHVLELSGSGGRGGGEDARARLNMFDSNAGGLLNPGRGTGDTQIVTPTKYRVDATLERRDTGTRLWEAWAQADLGQSAGETLNRAMVPVIARAIGRTVRQQPFAVP